MKRVSISAFALMLTLSMSAQSALDLQSRATLRQLRAQHPDVCAVQGRKAAPLHATSMTPVMMIVAPGTTNEQLEEEGIIVNARRENFVFASVAIDDVERVASQKTIRQMQLSRDVHQKIDSARVAIGVDKIHAGTGLTQTYTGAGVVTGIVDGGIDPNNINFLREDGTPRVEYLTHIYANPSSQSGYSMNEYNSENISKFKTDDATAYHGTHTLGIMAGGYKGNITMATQGSMMSADIVEAPNPYYGMAYNSEIVASCGTLQDYFIALGIESTLEYAYYMQKPAVVNLSLGGNTGPHDGTGILSRYMAMAGKEAIICVAAGNEGDLPIALNKTLTEDDKTVQTFVLPMNPSMTTEDGTFVNLRYGQVYIYSNDTTPFDIKAVVYNKTRQVLTFQDAAISSEQRGNIVYYATEGYEQGASDKSNGNFAKAFNGYLGVGADLDSTSHRYYTMLDYFVHDNVKTNPKGDYILGFIVTGKKAGQRIDCFGDGMFIVLNGYGQKGWQDGSQNGSISDMACGDGILVVGSYNNRIFYSSLDGKSYHYDTNVFAKGDVSSFSSWGTTIHGKNLPHVVAPGVTVISSISEPYTSGTNFASFLNYQQAKVEKNGKTYYWEEAIGTSMATPVVVGAIALWLEANPYLTIDDVKDIVAKTAIKDDYMKNSKADPVKWGAGKFDAYEGLKEAIRRTDINDVKDNSRLLVQTNDNRHFNIFVGGAKSLDATLYDLAGQAVRQYTVAGDELDIDATGLAAGVYVLQANQHSQKLIVQ